MMIMGPANEEITGPVDKVICPAADSDKLAQLTRMRRAVTRIRAVRKGADAATPLQVQALLLVTVTMTHTPPGGPGEFPDRPSLAARPHLRAVFEHGHVEGSGWSVLPRRRLIPAGKRTDGIHGDTLVTGAVRTGDWRHA
jgi:hypothetical protein